MQSEPTEWFALSATFGRALKAKDFLESRSVRCFVPMKHEVVSDGHQGKVRKLVPAITNLLFAHTTRRSIQALKSEVSYLQYLTRPDGARRIPIVVPDRQMEQFMFMVDYSEDAIEMFASPLKPGQSIEVIKGPLAGLKGELIEIEGKSKVVVHLDLLGSAGVDMPAGFVIPLPH